MVKPPRIRLQVCSAALFLISTNLIKHTKYAREMERYRKKKQNIDRGIGRYVYKVHLCIGDVENKREKIDSFKETKEIFKNKLVF